MVILGVTVAAVVLYKLATMDDYIQTMNHGWPPGHEVRVNFWTNKPLKK
jgi:hypothetical protein